MADIKNIGERGFDNVLPEKSVQGGSSKGSANKESDGKLGKVQSGPTNGRSSAPMQGVRGMPTNTN